MLTIIHRSPRARGIFRDRIVRSCRRLFALIADWRAQTRQRQSLARLDDRMLADVGLTRDIERWLGRR